MEQKNLHEIIIDVIKLAKNPVTVRQITETIAEKKLWYRPKDKKFPTANQVSARVNKYSHFFIREKGVVKLRRDEFVEDKITRICYNDRGWVEPSGRGRKSKTPGLHEAIHGFGHEEWLFDFNRMTKDYQYGFIEGFRTPNNKHGGGLYNIQLFTLDGLEKQKYWVAKINNCYVLTNEEEINTRNIFISKGWLNESKVQLEALDLWNNGASQSLRSFAPNVKFLRKDVTFLDPPLRIPHSNYIGNRDRYLLYDWNEVTTINTGNISEFNFKPSTPNSNKKVWRKTIPQFESREIKQLHRKISESLYRELSMKYGVENIACDLLNNSGTYIDMVRKKGNQYIFYEIKTYNQIRKNIREALGQLLEYGFWNRNKKIKEIIIVSDKKIDLEAYDYLTYLKNFFKIPISYLQQSIY